MAKETWVTMLRWQQRRRGRGQITPNTYDNQLANLEAFAAFVGPDTPLDQITPEDFEDWLCHLETCGSPHGGDYRASTINSKAAPVRKFFNDMNRRGHIRRDPCIDIPRRRVPPQLPRSLPPETLDRLIANAGSHRNRALIIVAATTGLRASELARMRVDNWDREAQRIMVTRAKTGPRGSGVDRRANRDGTRRVGVPRARRGDVGADVALHPYGGGADPEVDLADRPPSR